MKKYLSFTLTLCLGIIAASLRAGDAEHTYTGEITGVVCIECKEKVKTVLMKNLEGAISVDVKPSGKPEAQKLIVVSTSDHLSVGMAVTALGDYSKEYQILSLNHSE